MAQNKYESHVIPKLELVKGWAREGLTDEQIAKNLQISIQTFYNYKEKYLEFFESLKENKDIADFAVENALYKAAIEGNTTAQIFWLKNRKSKQWRDKQDIEHSIDDKFTSINITFGDKSKRAAHIEKDPSIVDGGALKEDNDL